jgi:hypothetical protein
VYELVGTIQQQAKAQLGPSAVEDPSAVGEATG